MNCVVLNIKIKYWSKQKSGHYLHQSFHFISGNSWAAQDKIIQPNWYPGSIKLSKDFYERFFPNKEKLDAQVGNIQLKKKARTGHCSQLTSYSFTLFPVSFFDFSTLYRGTITFGHKVQHDVNIILSGERKMAQRE